MRKKNSKIFFISIIFVVLAGIIVSLKSGKQKTDLSKTKKMSVVSKKRLKTKKISRDGEVSLQNMSLKPRAEGYIAPKKIEKQILDQLDNVKRNQDIYLRTDKIVFDLVRKILNDRSIKRDENNRIKYLSEDGKVRLSISFKKPKSNNIFLIYYENTREPYKFLASLKSSEEGSIFKERNISLFPVDVNNNNPLKLVGDESVGLNNGSASDVIINQIKDNSWEIYLYDVKDELIKIPQFIKESKDVILHSYDLNGNLIQK